MQILSWKKHWFFSTQCQCLCDVKWQYSHFSPKGGVWKQPSFMCLQQTAKCEYGECTLIIHTKNGYGPCMHFLVVGFLGSLSQKSKRRRAPSWAKMAAGRGRSPRGMFLGSESSWESEPQPPRSNHKLLFSWFDKYCNCAQNHEGWWHSRTCAAHTHTHTHRELDSALTEHDVGLSG